MPSSAATSAAGGAPVLRPRPLGRSGGVTTSCGRCGVSASAAQDGGGEVGGAEIDGPHAFRSGRALTVCSSAPGAPRARAAGRPPRPEGCRSCPRAMPAARPCAGHGERRSRIRTPSRWSISCWRTRASSPEASIVTCSPSSVVAADRDVQGPLDVHRDPRQAEAALLGDDQVIGAALDPRVDQRRRLARRGPPGRPGPGAGGRAGSRPGRPPCRRCMIAIIRSTSARSSGPKSVDRRGDALQHRVAELDDLGERRFAALDQLVLELGALALAGALGRFDRSPRRLYGSCRRRRLLRVDVDRDRDIADQGAIGREPLDRVADGADQSPRGRRP